MSEKAHTGNAAWYIVQTAPRTELDVVAALARLCQAEGAAHASVPSLSTNTHVHRGAVPYFGLVFWQVDLTPSLRHAAEALPHVHGLVCEPETYVVEFDGGRDEHVSQAIAKINQVGISQEIAAGRAPFVMNTLTEASKTKTLAALYLELYGVEPPKTTSFIEVNMRYTAHNRRLLREIPGVVDLLGGDAPVARRSKSKPFTRDSVTRPVTVSPEAMKQIQGYLYHVYVLQTSSNFEEQVVRSLHATRSHQEAALFAGAFSGLLINGVRLVNGEQRVEPGRSVKGYMYISAHMDADSWHLIKSTPRVIGFVGGSSLEKVRPVSSRELDSIGFSRRELKQSVAVKVEEDSLYAVGDLVDIIDGPFATYAGQIQEVDSYGKLLKVMIFTHQSSSARETRARFTSDLSFSAEVEFKQVRPADM
jgi:transcriptional antiterminator NusG